MRHSLLPLISVSMCHAEPLCLAEGNQIMTDLEFAKHEWQMYMRCRDACDEDLARIHLLRWHNICEKILEELMVLRRGRAKLASGQEWSRFRTIQICPKDRPVSRW
jgi:hypothetical protein